MQEFYDTYFEESYSWEETGTTDSLGIFGYTTIKDSDTLNQIVTI